MLVNERIPPGTVLVVGGKEEIDGRMRRIRRRYIAVKQYRHHVMVMEGERTVRCITNAELFQNGLVTQRQAEPLWWVFEDKEYRKRGPYAGPRIKGESNG